MVKVQSGSNCTVHKVIFSVLLVKLFWSQLFSVTYANLETTYIRVSYKLVPLALFNLAGSKNGPSLLESVTLINVMTVVVKKKKMNFLRSLVHTSRK